MRWCTGSKKRGSVRRMLLRMSKEIAIEWAYLISAVLVMSSIFDSKLTGSAKSMEAYWITESARAH